MFLFDRKILLVILRIIFSFDSISQTSQAFPSYGDSAIWNVAIKAGVPPINISTLSYTFYNDTTFCGFNYSIINSNLSMKGYVRSDSERVYIRTTNNCSDKEYLTYDYSLNVGDTGWFALFNCPTEPADTVRITIVGIDTISLYGIDRQRMKTVALLHNSELLDSANWIYGIGSDFDPFYSLDPMSYNFEIGEYKLLCFDSNEVELYKDPEWSICDTTYSGVNKLDDLSSVVVFPNPTNGVVELSSSNMITEIELYNLLGEKIKLSNLKWMREFNQEIKFDMSHTAPGVYTLLVRTNLRNEVYKVIKQ